MATRAAMASGLRRASWAWLPILALHAPAGAARTADEAKRAQAQFESTAAGYRRELLKLGGWSERERQTLADIQFVYERKGLPRAEMVYRFGERKVIVSDGWMMLAQEALRANAVSPQGTAPNCYTAYLAELLRVAGPGTAPLGQGAAAVTPALPSFRSFIEKKAEAGCQDVRLESLQSANTAKLVDEGLNAALVWLVGRLVALQMNSRNLPPASAASAADAASATQQRLETLCPVLAATTKALEHAHSIGVDLRPGEPAIRAHETLFWQGCHR